MKNVSLILVLVCLTVSAQAQEVIFDTSYYAPPPVRRRVLSADPEQRADPYRPNAWRNRTNQDDDVIRKNRLKEIQTWYISAEGGFRKDVSVLTNTFGNLISSTTPTKGIWSIMVGYTFRNAWSIETGYTRAPTHLNVTIDNTPSPFVFNYQNAGYGIPIRLKRRIGLGKNAANGTGFWVSGGAWLIPNGNQDPETLKFYGYYTYPRTHQVDSLQLNVTTGPVSRISGLAELGIEYATRLSSSLELGFFLRKYWGFGTAMRSDLTYTVNKTSQQQGTITANGTGTGFGITLRYIYGKQYELKTP